MSEEILKALMQLFAIIAKQDEGTSLKEREYVHLFLKQQLNESSVNEYLALFDGFAGYGEEAKEAKDDDGAEKRVKLTSVKDSVRTLGLCKKINKTLAQKQKIVVLVRLFELMKSDNKYSEQRTSIVDTVAEVFNITKEEYDSVVEFVKNDDAANVTSSDILVVTQHGNKVAENSKYIYSNIDGNLFILRIASVDLYFIRYAGFNNPLLNGLEIDNKRIYLFASGSLIKLPKDKPVFYTDVAAKFLADSNAINVSFQAKDILFKFPKGNIGLQDVNIDESSGKLIGIMGASGAGKTTLLNVLSGIEYPTSGDITINGHNLKAENELLKGVIGYIPQDDLLIEELTVFQNLYYNAKLVFKDITEEEANKKVTTVIDNLGLSHAKDLKVGNPLQKTISGGQRKRLNIGLELIREPLVLFVDEPTSGLSSRDSENVMELLRELTLKGKLIFIVIHQPSSDIYKMFDNVIILDSGGYQIYYGNPVEAVIYFKEQDNQVNSGVGECPTCGNVNPETIFNILESRIVDEYGRVTSVRKKTPIEWKGLFDKNNKKEFTTNESSELPETQKIPGKFNQLKTFFLRDMFSKVANTQYLAINFLQAPLIAAILAFILRYISDPTSSVYIFRQNENIMPFTFMAIIVALFLGLIVSAEEIFKDRKILKREAFLNLSRRSYLISKISILFIISAVQAFTFVIIANSILGIHGMFFQYWIVMFSMAAFANMLGLNISASFNSAVTIYILIPFLIIPQMVLAGAMFNFDKINKLIGGGSEKVPIIAEVMPSRWGFEALVVNQFVNNEYEQLVDSDTKLSLYEIEKRESQSNFKNVYLIPELKGVIEDNRFEQSKTTSPKPLADKDIALLKNEISKEMTNVPEVKFASLALLEPSKFNQEVSDEVLSYLDEIQDFYRKRYNFYNEKKDNFFQRFLSSKDTEEKFNKLKDNYYNDYLGAFAKNVFAQKPLVRVNNKFVQKIDPIYFDAPKKSGIGIRSHFMAPQKSFLGKNYSTFYVNLVVIWLFTILLYISLYYELISKTMNGISMLNELIISKLKRIKIKK
ncbi:MAG: ATP-binding cassette domain-containing protein [Bacteroidota bacterium]